MGHNNKIGGTKTNTASTSKPTYNNPHFFNRQTYFETQNPTTTVLKSPPFGWSWTHMPPWTHFDLTGFSSRHHRPYRRQQSISASFSYPDQTHLSLSISLTQIKPIKSGSKTFERKGFSRERKRAKIKVLPYIYN